MRIHLNRILCTTDLSSSAQQGVRYGIALARALNSELYVCSIIDPIPLAYAESLRDPEGYEEKMETKTQEKLAAMMADAKIPWTSMVRTGHPTTCITEISKEIHANLVIVTTRMDSGVKRFFMGSTSEELIRTLKIPLLILRDMQPKALQDFPEGPSLQLKHILVGHDFSYYATMALRYGLSLSREFGAKLHIVHVVSENRFKAFVADNPSGDSIDAQKAAMKKLKEKLDALVPKEAGSPCCHETHLLLGSAYNELRKYAMIHAIDLTLVGSRGISLAESMLMGSVTDRLIRENSCPVLSVQ